MARTKSNGSKAESTANLGFEAKLWLAADKLRNNLDAPEYKHVVLGLIYLKYIADIDDLKRAGVFNELRAKQLRAGADIRNKAAHGEFDQFTRSDVEQMIQGITNFLAEYLA